MYILNSIKLLLPALIPSWNFFDVISPSPRIQYRFSDSKSFLDSKNDLDFEWQTFRPRPNHISFKQSFKRMFWNPKWNESLFLVSCAERIIHNYTQHSENEILNRLERNIKINMSDNYLQFRLVFIYREGIDLKENTAFTSRIKKLDTNLTQ